MKKTTYLFAFISLIIISCSDDNIPMQLKQPSITQISPDYINAGSQIIITGTDLDDNPTFIFNGEMIEASNSSSSSIILNISEDATSGTLEIRFNQSEYNTEAYLKIVDPNWSEFEASNYFQIEFVSKTVGFAMGRLNDLYIDKTTDGGKTWTTMLQVPLPSSHFEAVSANVVYIRTTSNMIKKTIDGGYTWQNITGLDIGYFIEELFFKNELEGFLLANKLDKSYIFKTIDGGNTWNEVLEIDTPIHKIEVAYHNNDTSLLLNRENNEFIKTEDNGISWSTSSFNIATKGNPIKYNFIDKDNAWVSVDPLINSSGGLFMTADGGVTWESIEIPKLSERIINVTFFSELNGHILTDQGGNLYTNDGGETWRLFYIEELGDIRTASFFENTLYLIKGSKLLKKNIN